MNYIEFVRSINENKLHVVDKNKSINIKNDFQTPHYLITSSGTQNQKDYVFSLEKILSSSRIMVNHYKLNESDRWLKSISSSHVGGFSINVRAYISKMREPLDFKWSPASLERVIKDNSITLLSLVPTQVFDLVSFNIEAPKSIKAVFVGGAKLNSEVYQKAINLGWPLRLCYGMTETFAQMSYSENGLVYKPYESWFFKKTEASGLKIKGPSLYSYILRDDMLFKNEDEYFITGDLCEVTNEGFSILGRSDGLLKHKASFTDFNEIKKSFEKILLENQLNRAEFEIIAVENLRNDVDIVVVSQKNPLVVKELFSSLDIKGVFHVSEIPRTEIYKLKKTNLSQVLKKQILFS